MANQKLTQLSEIDSITNETLFYMVKGDTPISYKGSADQIAAFIDAQANPYKGPYTALVGTGQDYTEVNQALSDGHAGIIVLNDTTESANWNISKNVYIIALDVNIDMGDHNIDYQLASTASVSLAGISSDAEITFSPTSANYTLITNDAEGAIAIFNNFSIIVNTDQDSSDAISTATQTLFDNVYIYLPNALFGFSMKSNDSYIRNSVFIGGGSNCQLISSPSFEFSTEFSNIELRGDFKESTGSIQLLSNINAFAFYNNINVNTNSLLNGLAYFLIWNSTISNIFSVSAIDIDFTGNSAITNCDNINILNVSNAAGGAIINCNAATFNDDSTPGTVSKVANRGAIPNDYPDFTGVLSPENGGTGVNNSSNTITVSGDFSTSGSHTLNLTTTANTNITLPTSGTLATLAGTETLTNKSISGATNTLSAIPGSVLNNTSVTAAKIDLTGTFDFTSGIVKVATPVNSTDAANKDYVDSIIPTTPVIPYYDSQIASGSDPDTYSNIFDAINSGKVCIKTTISTSEPSSLSFTAPTYIYLEFGVTIDLSTSILDFTSTGSVIFVGADRFNCFVKYSPSSNTNFFQGAGSGKKVAFVNCGLDMSSATSAADVNSSSDGADVLLENFVFVSADYPCSLYIKGALSKSNNISVQGLSSSAAPTLLVSDGAQVSQLTYSGTFASNTNNLTVTNAQVDVVNVSLDADPGAGNGLKFYVDNSQLSNVRGNYDSAYNIIPDGSYFSLLNCINAENITAASDPDGTIVGCTAQAASLGTGTIIKSGNNPAIGNNTDGFITATSTDTLENKTISGSSNTLTDIPGSALNNNSVDSSKLTANFPNIGIHLTISTVTNTTYAIALYMGCNGLFNGIAEKAGSLVAAGTFDVLLNGVAIAGLSGIVPTTAGSYTSVSGSPTFSRGDRVDIVYSTTSGVVNHALSLDIEQLF